MPYDKNLSPVGWYVGKYVLRFANRDDPHSDDPDARFVTWVNTVIVKANDIDEAYDKVLAIARANADNDDDDPRRTTRLVLEGITDLLPIYEEIEDGAEILWAKHAPRSLKRIRDAVRPHGGIRQA